MSQNSSPKRRARKMDTYVVNHSAKRIALTNGYRTTLDLCVNSCQHNADGALGVHDC